MPPDPPALTPEQSRWVDEALGDYRRWADERVARGEITTEESRRIVAWRGWQLAQQASGAPPAGYVVRPGRVIARTPYVYDGAPYYVPYPGPYYGPAPYPTRPWGWGIGFCAGGFGHHFGASLCF